MDGKAERVVERDYPLPQFIENLRRLAGRGDGEEEVEFQIKWSAAD